MSLSNLHSFHFSQILQNTTALPEHVYQNINNRSSINQALHQYIKLRRRKTRRWRHTKKTVAQNYTSPQDSNSFTPPPFPEGREPVTINSGNKSKASADPFKQTVVTPARPEEKPKAKTTASASLKKSTPSEKHILRGKHSPTNRTKNTPTPPRPTQKASGNTVPPKKRSIEEKWLQAEPKTNPYGKIKVNSGKNLHPGKPDQHVNWKPGRGTVEKIDKLTGEIVHLAEGS